MNRNKFVTLHAVEQYGLDLDYPEITEYWKKSINRYIWSANRRARDLMEGGMTGQAFDRSGWGARIMCDGYAVHATQAYGVMYSAAFFEKDVSKLVQIAIDKLQAGDLQAILEGSGWGKSTLAFCWICGKRTLWSDGYFIWAGRFPADHRYCHQCRF